MGMAWTIKQAKTGVRYMPINIFIYKPYCELDHKIKYAKNINPEHCWTTKGQSFHEWQQDQEEIKQYKIDLAKKIEIPKHKVLDYWR